MAIGPKIGGSVHINIIKICELKQFNLMFIHLTNGGMVADMRFVGS